MSWGEFLPSQAPGQQGRQSRYRTLLFSTQNWYDLCNFSSSILSATVHHFLQIHNLYWSNYIYIYFFLQVWFAWSPAALWSSWWCFCALRYWNIYFLFICLLLARPCDHWLKGLIKSEIGVKLITWISLYCITDCWSTFFFWYSICPFLQIWFVSDYRATRCPLTIGMWAPSPVTLFWPEINDAYIWLLLRRLPSFSQMHT